MWNAIGLGISVALAAAAFARATSGSGHYDGAVYGMSAATHRRYGGIGIALAIAFAGAFVWPAVPTVPLLAVAVLAGIFYLTSFLRGAESDD